MIDDDDSKSTPNPPHVYCLLQLHPCVVARSTHTETRLRLGKSLHGKSLHGKSLHAEAGACTGTGLCKALCSNVRWLLTTSASSAQPWLRNDRRCPCRHLHVFHTNACKASPTLCLELLAAASQKSQRLHACICFPDQTFCRQGQAKPLECVLEKHRMVQSS